jgi:hypothetical protein
MEKIHIEGDPKLKNNPGKQFSMFIGRWQPWHDGHRWLIDQRDSFKEKMGMTWLRFIFTRVR